MSLGAMLLRQARTRAGLSKRELARRAHTSPAALVEYEFARRHPTTDTFERILRAAGYEAHTTLRPLRLVDPAETAARLVQVLDLGDQLPKRPAARRIAYPPFGR